MVIILTNAGQTVVGVAVWISKTALAFFLLRIFGACGRKTRWTIILPPVLLGLFVTAGLLAFWLECRPISYLWDRLNPDGICGDNAVYLNLIAAILSFLCDFIFAALPWFTLRNIQSKCNATLLKDSQLTLAPSATPGEKYRALQSEPGYFVSRLSFLISRAVNLHSKRHQDLTASRISAGACGIMRAVKLPTMSDGEYMST